jgi:hypothetical protein
VNKLVIMFSILVAVVLAFGCSTTRPPPTSAFHDDWSGLFVSVSKSFPGARSYYLGSDDKWSYFKTTGEPHSKPTYRKVEASSMNLSHTFPFGQGKPYQIQSSDFRVNQKLAPVFTPEPTGK